MTHPPRQHDADDPDWTYLMAETTAAIAARALEISSPRTLDQTRERPFELALAAELNSRLPPHLAARCGGKPGLADFPRLGNYDVSVEEGRAQPTFDAVIEFKWWGAPGAKGGPPAKRDETLWDVLKVACTVAAGRSIRGYITALAPTTTWDLSHDFSDLFSGGEVATRGLCERNPGAMRFFYPEHFEATEVPESVVAIPIPSDGRGCSVGGASWIVKTIAIAPAGEMARLPEPRVI